MRGHRTEVCDAHVAHRITAMRPHHMRLIYYIGLFTLSVCCRVRRCLVPISWHHASPSSPSRAVAAAVTARAAATAYDFDGGAQAIVHIGTCVAGHLIYTQTSQRTVSVHKCTFRMSPARLSAFAADLAVIIYSSGNALPTDGAGSVGHADHGAFVTPSLHYQHVSTVSTMQQHSDGPGMRRHSRRPQDAQIYGRCSRRVRSH